MAVVVCQAVTMIVSAVAWIHITVKFELIHAKSMSHSQWNVVNDICLT